MTPTEISSFPANLTVALTERGHTADDLLTFSPDDIFREFCEWHGLLNWSQTLAQIFRASRGTPAAYSWEVLTSGTWTQVFGPSAPTPTASIRNIRPLWSL